MCGKRVSTERDLIPHLPRRNETWSSLPQVEVQEVRSQRVRVEMPGMPCKGQLPELRWCPQGRVSRAKASGLQSCTLERGDSLSAGRGSHWPQAPGCHRTDSFTVTPQRGSGAGGAGPGSNPCPCPDPHSLSGGSGSLPASSPHSRVGRCCQPGNPCPHLCPSLPQHLPAQRVLGEPLRLPPTRPPPGQRRRNRACLSAELYELEFYRARTLSGHSSFTESGGGWGWIGPSHGPLGS